MRVVRIYTIIVQSFLFICCLLGMTSYYYSSKRHQLVRSIWLRIYSGLMTLFSLGGYYFYFTYGIKYFVPTYFHHPEWLLVLCVINMSLHFVLIISQIGLRWLNEKEISQIYNQLMELCYLWRMKRSISYTGQVLILIKAFTYVHQITSPLVGLLIVVEYRQLTFMDVFCNVYFMYNFNIMHSTVLAYMLMLLQLAETMKINVSQGQINFWTRLRRQTKLSQMTQRIYQIFAPEILIVLITHLFYNSCTFYLAYSLTKSGEFWNTKVQLSIFSFLIKLVDVLLIELVCEHVLANEKQLIEQLKNVDIEFNQRECEIAQLMQSMLNSKTPPKNVLGMFSLDKRCAFNIMSSSLGYAIIIVQIGYIHQQNRPQLKFI